MADNPEAREKKRKGEPMTTYCKDCSWSNTSSKSKDRGKALREHAESTGHESFTSIEADRGE